MPANARSRSEYRDCNRNHCPVVATVMSRSSSHDLHGTIVKLFETIGVDDGCVALTVNVPTVPIETLLKTAIPLAPVTTDVVPARTGPLPVIVTRNPVASLDGLKDGPAKKSSVAPAVR